VRDIDAGMSGAKWVQQGVGQEDRLHDFVEGREMTMTSGKALLWPLAAGMLLAGGAANAATCSVTVGPQTWNYVVNTTPASSCYDYDDGNIPPDIVNNVLPPVPFDDALNLPVGYSSLGAGAVNLNSDGTFSLNVASSDDLYLFLKQGNSWATFLLGAYTGTWSINGQQGISHWDLYGNATTVVPIPPAALLLGSGLLGLIGIGRRRKSTPAAA
jgi:hypothetical protein